MKKLTTKVAVGLAATIGLATIPAAFTSTVAGATTRGTAGAAPTTVAPTTSTTLGPPAQGVGTHKLFLYVDTVTGGGTPKPADGCAQTNLFQPGQLVVFRMYGINAAAGGTNLTSQTVLAAYVRIPGVKAIPLVYGTHGTTSYWTAPWSIAKNYPVGTVNFVVQVTTKAVPGTVTSPAVAGEAGTFSQNGLAPPSRLTIVKA